MTELTKVNERAVVKSVRKASPNLDLPDMGEQFFWEVRCQGILKIDYVMLYKSHRFWFPTKVAERALNFRYTNGDLIPPEDAIRRGAERIAEELQGSHAWSGYYGTYRK